MSASGTEIIAYDKSGVKHRVTTLSRHCIHPKWLLYEAVLTEASPTWHLSSKTQRETIIL